MWKGGVNIDSGTFGKMQSGIYASSHTTLGTTHEEATQAFHSYGRGNHRPPRSRAKDLERMGLGIELDP